MVTSGTLLSTENDLASLTGDSRREAVVLTLTGEEYLVDTVLAGEAYTGLTPASGAMNSENSLRVREQLPSVSILLTMATSSSSERKEP